MNLFLGLFFVSGFCSLVYEVVWLRLAMGVFGVTAPFVSLFLSVFMVGLGLGSWGAGRLCKRLETKPASYALRFYAGAELLIALSALVVPFLLSVSRHRLADLFGDVAWGSFGYYWASGLCTALILIPWCACMGATFPLAMAAIEKRFKGQSANSFSSLYLANVFGAGLGTLVSAFVLIELYGFRGTLYLSAGLNIAIAAVAMAASFARSMRLSHVEAKAEPAAPRTGSAARSGTLLLLFMTGLISMAMEIVWTRQFTPYLGNTVYAFAVVLATYLLSTFVGSCFYRALIARSGAQYDAAWMVSGAISLLPLYAVDPYLPLNVFVRIGVGIVPFCCVLGFLTPALIDRWSAGDPGRAGTAYAVNIVGCILGPVIAGFLLLPWMQERYALALLSAPLFVAGLLAARRQRGGTLALGRLTAMPLFGATAAAALLVFLSSSTLDDQVMRYHDNARFIRDYQANVTVAGEGKDRVLQINNVAMTRLTPITKVMGHLPLAFLPRPPRSALVICFGMGTTFRSLVSWGIASTAVELVPSVPKVFGFFHEDAQQVMASAHARVVVDDGRRFLARTTEQFDVITLDPAPPMDAAGTSFLFSEEFYAEAQKRLAPDGIMQLWIMEPLEPLVISAFAKAIKNSFPYVRVFRSLGGWGYHCIVSRKPIPRYTAAELTARMPKAAVRDFLDMGPYKTGVKQFQFLLDTELDIDTIILPGAVGLRDDRPINEYFYLRALRGGH